jgi:transketolase
MPNRNSTARLDERSRALRRLIFATLVAAGRGHPGPALSLVEIMRVLYDDVLRVRPDQPDWEERDRCILSKGHGCLALYAVLADRGFFPRAELDRFCKFDGILGGHPEYGTIPGVEASTGALGHGPSIGIGLALAARMKGNGARVFVVTGDGELNEGSVWEAALSAGKHKLDNLTILVDHNKLQSYGPVEMVQSLAPLADKFRSFGFGVAEVDGHDVAALRLQLAALPMEAGKPSVVICHTIKGRGVPEAENNPDWHHKNTLTEAELASIRAALGASADA